MIFSDLPSPAEASKRNDKPMPRFRAGGKPVSTFLNHARAVCSACQTRYGVDRHIEMPHAVLGERVEHRIDRPHGSPPAQPASPQPLTPSGLVVVGTPCRRRERRRVRGARHRVIHVRPGEQLTFGRRRPRAPSTPGRALHHAAMHLALTSIGLSPVPKSLTPKYFTISTKPVSGSISTSATWHAVGIGRRHRAVADMRDVERLRNVGRQLQAAAQLRASSMIADGAVRAGNDEAAVLELDVSGCRFEHVCGDLLALLDHLGGAFEIAVPLSIADFEPPVPPPSGAGRCRPASGGFFRTERRAVRSALARTASRGPGRNRACR